MKTGALAFLALFLSAGAAGAQETPALWDDADRHAAPMVESNVDLVKLDEHLYMTEHVLFIVDLEDRIDWPEWSSFYSEGNIEYYTDQLLSHFPDTFMTVTFIGHDLEPDRVPDYGAGVEPKAAA